MLGTPPTLSISQHFLFIINNSDFSLADHQSPTHPNYECFKTVDKVSLLVRRGVSACRTFRNFVSFKRINVYSSFNCNEVKISVATFSTSTKLAKPEDNSIFYRLESNENTSANEELDSHDREDERVYIYGDHYHGLFLAHCLRRLQSPPPITLLMGSKIQHDRWQDNKAITVHYQPQNYDQVHSGFVVELGRAPFVQHGRHVTMEDLNNAPEKPHLDSNAPGSPKSEHFSAPDSYNTSPIQYLIMANDPSSIAPRLKGIRHRLSPNSVILLLHTGLGVLEDIVARVFPDPSTRPHLIQGFSTHRLYPNRQRKNHFSVSIHTLGSLTVTPLPRFENGLFDQGPLDTLYQNGNAENVQKFIDKLKLCPDLLVSETSVIDMFMMKLDDLLIESIIGPLSALADCKLGELLYTRHITASMRLLLAELCIVVKMLPELSGYANLNSRFSSENVEAKIVAKCFSHRLDLHPMAAHIRSASPFLSIMYLNGWLIKRGEELGVKCWMNYIIEQTVLGKSGIIRKEKKTEVPMLYDGYGSDRSR